MRALALLVVLGTLFTQSDSVRALLSDQASSVDEWDPRTASISTSWGDIMLEVRHIQDAPSSGGVLSRLHRSYKKIGYSAKLCIEALTKSAQQERSMTLVNESTSLRAHTCERSTGWADPRWSAAETTGALPGAKDVPATRRSTRLLMDEAEILFVVMAFVPNPLNARLLDLCLASLAAFHPRANVLVVDNGSPRRDLVEAVLVRRRAAAGAAAAAAATDAAVAEAKGATAAALAARSRIFLATAHGGPALPPNEALLVARSALGGSVAEHAHLARHARQPFGMEIGALRAAVAFVEAHALSAAGKPPPALVVALPHSTGLRLPLPLPEMTEKLASATCAAFALEVPWFRYDSPRFSSSRYGAHAGVMSFLARLGSVPSAFSKASRPNEAWRGNTHGTLAMPWPFLRDGLRRLGLLSDVARDACGTLNCCCFEQLSGLAFDWLAPGNSQWRASFAEVVGRFASSVGSSSGSAGSNASSMGSSASSMGSSASSVTAAKGANAADAKAAATMPATSESAALMERMAADGLAAAAGDGAEPARAAAVAACKAAAKPPRVQVQCERSVAIAARAAAAAAAASVKREGFTGAWPHGGPVPEDLRLAFPASGQAPTGTLRDLRCIIPVIWKVHGGTTEAERNFTRQERGKLAEASAALGRASRLMHAATAAGAAEEAFFSGAADDAPPSVLEAGRGASAGA